MKKRSRKNSMIVIVTLVLTIFISTVAFAKSYTNVYVYGDRYKVVANGTFDDSSNYVTVTLTEILKSDGNSSDYKTVRADVINSSGNQISVNTNVAVDLQKSTNIVLNRTYASGTSMKLRMKGNKSSLDCIVDFTAPIS